MWEETLRGQFPSWTTCYEPKLKTNSLTKDFLSLSCQCIYNDTVSAQRSQEYIHKINCLSFIHLLVPGQSHLMSRHEQDLCAVPLSSVLSSSLFESVYLSAYKPLSPCTFHRYSKFHTCKTEIIFPSKLVSPPLFLTPWTITHHSLPKPESSEFTQVTFSLSHTQSPNPVNPTWKENLVFFLLFILITVALLHLLQLPKKIIVLKFFFNFYF